MFTKKEIKANLLGCFEICLFMRSGIDRFSSSKQAALRSFIIPFLCLVPLIYIISLQGRGSAEGSLFLFQLMRISLTLGVFYATVYTLCRSLDRSQYFYQFINASNWTALPVMILLAPVAVIVGFHLNTYDNVEGYAIFTAIAGYIVTGYVATHALRLPWQLGTFVAIISLAINDISLQISEFISGMI